LLIFWEAPSKRISQSTELVGAVNELSRAMLGVLTTHIGGKFSGINFETMERILTTPTNMGAGAMSSIMFASAGNDQSEQCRE